MRINILRTFLDGTRRFEEGEKNILVSDEDGKYFCENFGAEDVVGVVPTGELKPGTTKLDIRGIKREQKSEVTHG